MGVRTWVVGLAGVVVFLGCGAPPSLRHEAELIILNAGATGELLASAHGETVDLGPVSADCVTRVPLTVRNIGLADATLSFSAVSLQVEPASAHLGPGDSTVVTVRLPAPVIPPFAASLDVDLNGTVVHFPLIAAVMSVDSEWPQRIDFGGVEQGRSERVESLELLGLGAPFGADDGGVRFSPSSLGHFEQSVAIARRAECSFAPRVLVVGDGVAHQLTGPSDVTFAATQVGQSVERVVRVANFSLLPSSASGALLSGSPFSLVGEPLVQDATRDADGGLVAGTLEARVRFSPTASAQSIAQLRFTSGSQRLLIPLRGTGLP